MGRSDTDNAEAHNNELTGPRAEMALAMLRVQLFAAAQRLRGANLQELRTLLGDVLSVIEFEMRPR